MSAFGWCLGIGHIGAIVGSLFAGELIRCQWPNGLLLAAAWDNRDGNHVFAAPAHQDGTENSNRFGDGALIRS
jgi:hypothetical protein